MRVLVMLGLAWGAVGCVTPSVHGKVSEERDALETQLERMRIERDNLQKQYLEAQESYEDERVTRSELATDLAQTTRRATELDASLTAERDARIKAAEELAARKAEIAKIQSTYDELVTDLESEVSSGQIEIQRLKEGLRLNVSDEVLFATGSAELDSIGRDVLKKVAGQIRNLRDFIEVRGHTDNLRIGGSLAKRYPSNWELAAARAARVVRLFEAEGIPGDRLVAVSLGENDPVVPNDSPDNRALNRRIEIRLLPKGGAGQPGDADERIDSAGETPPAATSVR
jgi:chemotaxis protein MotB